MKEFFWPFQFLSRHIGWSVELVPTAATDSPLDPRRTTKLDLVLFTSKSLGLREFFLFYLKSYENILIYISPLGAKEIFD